MDIKNKIVVGNVIKIDNGKVTILMHKNTNVMTYFHNGKIYRGVSVGEYIGIIRGPLTIIAKIENEFLEDKFNDHTNHSFEKNRFERYIDVRIIGQFNNGKYEPGIKYFPLVYNEVILLSEPEISTIIEGSSNVDNEKFTIKIGNTVQENLPYRIRWDNLFNTHIGIFGNTGSGKSNTLAKLYTGLFNLNDELLSLSKSSKFVVLDFNGEYIGEEVFSKYKNKIRLNTSSDKGEKLQLTTEQFYNVDTLSILYSATEKTQRPFLQSALKFFYEAIRDDKKLSYFIGSAYYNTFEYNNNKESLNLLKRVLDLIGYKNSSAETYNLILNSTWFGGGQSPSYRVKNNYLNGDFTHEHIYVNNIERAEILDYRQQFEEFIDEHYSDVELSLSNSVKMMVYLHLVYNLSFNHVQFDHISPLIQRIESNSVFIDKLFEIISEDNYIELKEEEHYITVISLKDCNIDAKKIVPLLIAKESYDEHKKANYQSNTNTFHLIIDEAHNILSEQSEREADSWKDYRLSVFEEIIKEGRKFGFYLTISTQRPYDISPTIMSQLHNYFLHRLVNENDIKMLNNTINTLDQLSRNRIPTLSPGQCILTGTSFDSPMLIQVDLIDNINQRPDSDNTNLVELWDFKTNSIKMSLEKKDNQIKSLIEDELSDSYFEEWLQENSDISFNTDHRYENIVYEAVDVNLIEHKSLEHLENNQYSTHSFIDLTLYYTLTLVDDSYPFEQPFIYEEEHYHYDRIAIDLVFEVDDKFEFSKIVKIVLRDVLVE